MNISASGYICQSCGSGNIKYQERGNFLILLIAICLWVIPGVIYAIWMYGGTRKMCKTCKSENIIPINSPLGKRLIETLVLTDVEPVKQNYNYEKLNELEESFNYKKVMVVVFLLILIIVAIALNAIKGA